MQFYGRDQRLKKEQHLHLVFAPTVLKGSMRFARVDRSVMKLVRRQKMISITATHSCNSHIHFLNKVFNTLSTSCSPTGIDSPQLCSIASFTMLCSVIKSRVKLVNLVTDRNNRWLITYLLLLF